MLEVMKGLEGYKKCYEDFTLDFEREGGVSGVSGLEIENLDRWLTQTREFQRAADATLKSLGNDCVLVCQGKFDPSFFSPLVLTPDSTIWQMLGSGHRADIERPKQHRQAGVGGAQRVFRSDNKDQPG